MNGIQYLDPASEEWKPARWFFDRYKELVADNERLTDNFALVDRHVGLMKVAMIDSPTFECGICGADDERPHDEDCELLESIQRLRLATTHFCMFDAHVRCHCPDVKCEREDRIA